MTVLKAGASKVEITPPIGKAMGGYLARQGVASGVHDPLWAKVIVLKQDDLCLALVSCDLLGLDLEVVKAIEVTIPEVQHLIIACTHTHSGCAGLTPPFDRDLVDLLKTRIPQAVRLALNNCVECRISYGSAPTKEVALNRRNPLIPIDTDVRVLRFDDQNGQAIAGIIHYACHPTVLSHENLDYSADFPGVTCNFLSEATSVEVVMFLNGAAGDISTRFTRLEASFDEVTRLGNLLGSAALQAWLQAIPQKHTRLELNLASFLLSARQLPTPKAATELLIQAQLALEAGQSQAVAKGHLRQLETALQGAQRLVRMASEGVSLEPFELVALRIGDVCLVTNPGEMFSDFATKLHAGFEFPVLIVGYANGRAGYIPTTEALQQGGYEVDSSRYEVDTGDRLVKAYIQLISSFNLRSR